MSELRWNPILEEWVITATWRQDRTFLPPKDYCPLCPSRPGHAPTEVPESTYQIVCFENRFPSLQPEPPEPAVPSTDLYPVAPAQGVCEVVLYTPQHEGTLTERSVEEIGELIHVWADRTRVLGALDYIKYVLIFENKGKEIGVTIQHPHGQIYAFPFIPPKLEREIASAAKHRARTGRCLFCDVLRAELTDGRRIVAQNDSFVVGVPFYARYPYETHIWSRRHLGKLPEMSAGEMHDLAAILKTTLLKFDSLWGISLPYMMLLHQSPTDGDPHDEFHFHMEFYPPYRTKEKLKYLASVESGAGTFINDTLAEEKAEELRRAAPATRPDGTLE
ncbi:MAG TPA: galactose-1-phosphate uridylyltransferase [Armatimonadota bacterium]|nr:galactose-1-phosphate uridylyltransferase [Armatimonadota bacterium]